MPKIRNSRGLEVFNDGLLSVCEAEERTLTRTKIENIRFGKRTVGVTRFWQAKTAGNKVDKLLSIPADATGVDLIEVNDIVILDNETDWLWDTMTFDDEQMKDKTGQYQILQIQEKFDARPPALYLSLEKVMHPFTDRRTDG